MPTAVLVMMLVVAAVMLVGGAWVLVRSVRRIAVARRRWLAVKRLNRGFCPQCAYDMAGRPSVACPECGYQFAPNELKWLEAVWPFLRDVRDTHR